MKLIPVKYHKKDYPASVRPQLIEVAGNLDSKQIYMSQPYSLHTEYSYMKRDFNSELLADLDELKNAHYNGVPQLWKSEQWSREYAVFIKRLARESIPPEIIEIHPPFLDYCADIDIFWERYLVFYHAIKAAFPDTKILMENRCGTTYSKSAFLLSTCTDMLEFCRFLSNEHSELGLIVDYPQLFSAEKVKMDQLKLDRILQFNKELKNYAHTVGAIHLWGKEKRKSKKSESYRWSPHCGDLNTFFSGDLEKKKVFLTSMKETFNDPIERYFVPEVNTTEEDLQSIVTDLISVGIIFVQKDYPYHLISIDWENGAPQFVLQNNIDYSVQWKDAIGQFAFSIGPKQYCIGNRDMVDHSPMGCPIGRELTGDLHKCDHCEQDDLLKFCARCTGKYCPVTNPVVLERCAQEHFIYLAYFPYDTIKVGVAHGRRKYIRLYEQGALCALFAFTCSDGKTARQFENLIRMTGIRDKITSQYKLNNLSHIDLIHARNMLMAAYSAIIKKLSIPNGISPVCPPEYVIQQESIRILNELPVGNQQLSLWDDGEPERIVVDTLGSVDGFQGEIQAFVGNIAIMKRGDSYHLFDFKNIIGRELSIISCPSDMI